MIHQMMIFNVWYCYLQMVKPQLCAEKQNTKNKTQKNQSEQLRFCAIADILTINLCFFFKIFQTCPNQQSIVNQIDVS